MSSAERLGSSSSSSSSSRRYGGTDDSYLLDVPPTASAGSRSRSRSRSSEFHIADDSHVRAAASSGSSAWQRTRTTRMLCSIVVLIALVGALAGVFFAGRRSDACDDAAAASSNSGGAGGNPLPTIPANAFTFNDMFNSSTRLGYSALSWSVDDSSAFLQRDASGAIVKCFVNVTQPCITLLSAQQIGNRTIQSYSFSPNQQFILVASQITPLYRHSYSAVYALFNTKDPGWVAIAGSQPLQAVEWSPSMSTPRFSYVLGNNIYVYSVDSGATITLSTDGAFNSVIHGVCDWAYEEEIWGRSGVMFWSNAGDTVAWLRFNEAQVPQYSFPVYGFPADSAYTYKYPKAGANNSVVTVGVARILSDVAAAVTWLDTSSTSEQYVIDVKWMQDSVGVKFMPRLQRSFQIKTYNMSALGSSVPLWPVAHAFIPVMHPLYLEPTFAWTYLPARNEYLDLHVHSDQQHLARFSAINGSLIEFVTDSTDWSVLDLACYDTVQDIAYFHSNRPSSTERALFAVSVFNRSVTMVVAQASPVWQSASFSAGCSNFVLTESAQFFNTCLYATPSFGAAPTLLSELSNNARAMSALSQFALPKQVFTQIPSVVAPGRMLNAYFLLPPSFKGDLSNPDCSQRLPVLINVYGGPGAQLVTRRFVLGNNGNAFHMALSSSLSYVIFVVDPIGTGGQGDSFQKNYTYLQLGINEERDILASIEYLRSLCFINTSNVNYWGWSYGGMMASRIATNVESASKVRAVVAVAPVTDWHLYDSIYTERYMQTPDQNPDGYARTSLLLTNRPSTLSTKGYLLVHGTADDNVHFQNSALFVQQLVNKPADFRTFYYPNLNHGLNGGANRHLYAMLTRFVAPAYADVLAFNASSSAATVGALQSTASSAAWDVSATIHDEALSSSLLPLLQDRRRAVGMTAEDWSGPLKKGMRAVGW